MEKFVNKKGWNKCDDCGCFIPIHDFSDGLASRKLTTPDAEGSLETYETLCRKHKDKNDATTNL